MRKSEDGRPGLDPEIATLVVAPLERIAVALALRLRRVDPDPATLRRRVATDVAAAIVGISDDIVKRRMVDLAAAVAEALGADAAELARLAVRFRVEDIERRRTGGDLHPGEKVGEAANRKRREQRRERQPDRAAEDGHQDRVAPERPGDGGDEPGAPRLTLRRPVLRRPAPNRTK